MPHTRKATQCIHAGHIMDPQTRGMVSPVYPSTAFDYRNVDIKAYPRYFNTPNQRAVSQKLAALENGEEALVFSSGMAAVSTVLFGFLQQGDHAIFQNDLYGGTHHAIVREMERFGIAYDFVDSLKPVDYEAVVRPETKLIYIETPSNPLLKLMDMEAIADIAKRHHLVSVIDNTFASSINQNPIDHGIDVVIHSGTKYLGGHSDLCCGAVISSAQLMKEVHRVAINFGGSLNAQDCYLLERSLKTLALRVRQQNENALAIAEFLQNQTAVKEVHYPGLASHPDYQLAQKQMSGFGGMLSFELKDDPEPFLNELRLIPTAMSLGGVESTITSPVQTSHAKMSPEARQQAGITDNLLRLSVGIEDVEDLIEDLEGAL